MAKTLTPSEIAEQLVALGMPVPEELKEKAANEKTDAIERGFYDHLTSIEKESTRVATASKFRVKSNEFASFLMALDSKESGKPGRGDKKFALRSFTVETPDGELVVKLYSEK